MLSQETCEHRVACTRSLTPEHRRRHEGGYDVGRRGRSASVICAGDCLVLQLRVPPDAVDAHSGDDAESCHSSDENHAPHGPFALRFVEVLEAVPGLVLPGKLSPLQTKPDPD